jgi:hypothetical protein
LWRLLEHKPPRRAATSLRSVTLHTCAVRSTRILSRKRIARNPKSTSHAVGRAMLAISIR